MDSIFSNINYHRTQIITSNAQLLTLIKVINKLNIFIKNNNLIIL